MKLKLRCLNFSKPKLVHRTIQGVAGGPRLSLKHAMRRPGAVLVVVLGARTISSLYCMRSRRAMENSSPLFPAPHPPLHSSSLSPSPEPRAGRPCRVRRRPPRTCKGRSPSTRAGDDPLKFYFPLLLYHVCAVFALSRGVHALLSRANVPLVISQIVVRRSTYVA
jgi:hypothetical protein